MQAMLEALQDAREAARRPGKREEWACASGELQVLNERIRNLWPLQTECMTSLKKNDFYSAKVGTMREGDETAKQAKDKMVQRRV
jgi:hypothetical protein